MSRFARSVAVALLLCLPVGAWGHGFGLLWPRTTVAYYYPAPVSYVPVLAVQAYPICVVPSAPRPVTPARTYAPPTPAPPSAGPSTPEPPLAEPLTPKQPSSPPTERSAGFGEAASFYDAYPVASDSAAKPIGERRQVEFWNLTDRDVILHIDGGPPQSLRRGKSVTAFVGRLFTWQVEGHAVQTAPVDRSESALQIVIRR
ncbi:MAG TPA: hypothetical protein VKU02_04910 [Gemmataceae bacterium]|nr:hypothetical protein [Gemmataceae bacterium]